MTSIVEMVRHYQRSIEKSMENPSRVSFSLHETFFDDASAKVVFVVGFLVHVICKCLTGVVCVE